jgi:hypothetical protein
VHLPVEWKDKDAELEKLKETQKQLTDRRDELENQLRQAIGMASVAVIDGGPVYTYRTVDRREFLTPATSYRTLRRRKSKEAADGF